MLIGYAAKRRTPRPDGLEIPPRVEEVCSVSDCICLPAEGWIDRWLHNDMWFYDTPELAWSVVPELDRKDFGLYAYKLFPVLFDQGERRDLKILPVTPMKMASSFEFLGYDVAGPYLENRISCSPLSCNHMAATVETNKYCLVDELERALELPAIFEERKCEPGPYCVVEVWRARK